MEMDFETETKKNSELSKSNRRIDRKLKEMTFQLQEEQENGRRHQEQISQHQSRDKQLRRRAEEAVSPCSSPLHILSLCTFGACRSVLIVPAE